MARRIGPDEGSREVRRLVGKFLQGRPNRPVTVYTDAAATILADIRTLAGAVLPGSVVYTDAYSMLPLFQFPDGDVDTLYGVCDSGPVWPIYARTDDRLDAVEARAAAAETPAGAQAKADAVQALAALRAANLSDLANAGTARTNLGLGNVNNTSDTNKPVSTATATALAGKVAKGEIVVNVKDYGAVGDATYIDQRLTTPNSFGLVGMTPTNPATFGRGFTDQNFTLPATDNTAAFQQAWDALMTAGQFSLRQRDVATGYKSLRKKLHIPAGAYYISDAAALFSLARVTPSGVQAGVDISGDGYLNTILYVRIPNSGATDYMFYDNNWFNGMSVQGVTIIGTTATERFFYQTSAGTAKRWRMTDCFFSDYKTFLTIEGAVNADRWVFNACQWHTWAAGARLMSNQVNSQAVGFDFHSPAITHMNGGDIFDIAAGGHIHLFGGTTELYGLAANGAAGRFAYVHGVGSGLGYQTFPVMALYGHKFELHDDAGLVDINWNFIVFRDCNAPVLGNVRWANGLKHHVVVRGRGSVIWEDGMFGDMYLALSTNLTDDYSATLHASALFRDAIFEVADFANTRVGWFTSAGDGLTTSHIPTFGTGAAGIGRLQLEGCQPIPGNYATAPSTNVALNGSPYASRMFSARPARVQRVTHRSSSSFPLGLPGEGSSAVIKVPVGCQLVRVGIVKHVAQTGISSASRTWQVADGNGTVLATMTTTGTTSNVTAFSPESYRVLATANDATFTLSCTTAGTGGTGAEGYFSVEYI